MLHLERRGESDNQIVQEKMARKANLILLKLPVEPDKLLGKCLQAWMGQLGKRCANPHSSYGVDDVYTVYSWVMILEG